MFRRMSVMLSVSLCAFLLVTGCGDDSKPKGSTLTKEEQEKLQKENMQKMMDMKNKMAPNAPTDPAKDGKKADPS